MRAELPTLRHWQQQGATVAVASVIATSHSAPRQPGAVLGLHPDGDVLGSVSGGCVEGAVVEVATQVLDSGVPQRLSYGVSDDEAFSVGLTCGGTIEVFVRAIERATVDFDDLATRLDRTEPVAVVTVIEHVAIPGMAGRCLVVTADGVRGDGGVLDDASLGGLDRAMVDEARAMLATGATGLRHLGARGERRREDVTVFVESFAPRPRLLIFGAVDFSAALASMGRFLGYHVTVCDARARFATSARFPDADEVVVDWPHRFLARSEVDARTAICVLTHDPKFDVPVLQEALRTSAAYLGVMGSRRTHDDRLRRLREVGVAEHELARLHSPIGLDLGARTPAETAVSIAAELVLDRHGGTGQPLRDTAGAIHRPFPPPPALVEARRVS